MSKPSPLAALSYAAAALGLSIAAALSVGVESLSVGDAAVRTRVAASASIAVSLFAGVAVHHEAGATRETVERLLFAFGLPAVLLGPGTTLSLLGTAALTAYAALAFDLDERVRARRG